MLGLDTGHVRSDRAHDLHVFDAGAAVLGGEIAALDRLDELTEARDEIAMEQARLADEINAEGAAETRADAPLSAEPEADESSED